MASLEFSLDGTILVGKQDAILSVISGMNPRLPGETFFWNPTNSHELPQFADFKEWCQWVVFAPDSKSLVTNGTDSDYWIHLWDAATGRERRTFELGQRILTAAFSR